MSRLPEKGDAERAAEMMNARTLAAVSEEARGPDGSVRIGPVGEDGDRLGGIGGDAMRLMWGDLLDIGEYMDVHGTQGVFHAIQIIGRGELDAFSTLASMTVQAAAFGVLMERARWEGRDAS